MHHESDGLKTLYSDRFAAEEEQRDEIWRVLCSDFFQQWVEPQSTVLDLAAGHCEFINNIKAARKIAVDLNPDVEVRAAAGVETHVLRSDALTTIPDAAADVVFISNFFEHITREAILSTLVEVRRVLKPTGRLLLLQPNVRFCAKDYWQFFDHITPIDDRALLEAFRTTDFDVTKTIARFLPYSTKGRLPRTPSLVRLYLKFPLVWRILGAQTFMIAKPAMPGQRIPKPER